MVVVGLPVAVARVHSSLRELRLNVDEGDEREVRTSSRDGCVLLAPGVEGGGVVEQQALEDGGERLVARDARRVARCCGRVVVAVRVG